VITYRPVNSHRFLDQVLHSAERLHRFFILLGALRVFAVKTLFLSRRTRLRGKKLRGVPFVQAWLLSLTLVVTFQNKKTEVLVNSLFGYRPYPGSTLSNHQ